MNKFTVEFFGVGGSIPSPLTAAEVETKIVHSLQQFLAAEKRPPSAANIDELTSWMRKNITFSSRATHGGNTTCVVVRCDDELLILDMGTGLRLAGLSLMPETLANKGLAGTVFLSHVHWDHIQGFPFWPQLFMPREVYDNSFTLYGGKDYEESLQDVLQGQMDHPVFPVLLGELNSTAMKLRFEGVHDRMSLKLGGNIKVRCRKLHHPQETFGYRIEFGGKSLAFTTDHEPYPAPDPALVDLVNGVDLWITDCQYSKHDYTGENGGVAKLGWGHSYPEALAEVSALTKPKRIITTHHDPCASDEHIVNIASELAKLSKLPTEAAWEGLKIAL